MNIKTVALMGAGAIGSYFIRGMTETLGNRFCVVADGSRAKRLKENGIVINEKRYRPSVKTAEEAAGCDLLLICTKYNGLLEALDDVARIVQEHTVVMSLLNGIDSEELIAERIGREHIVCSFMRIQSARAGEGFSFRPEVTRGAIFGETDGSRSERVLAIAALFDETGINYKIHGHILEGLWGKYAVNICYNLPQAVLGLDFISYFRGPHVAFIRDRLFEEVSAVGRAEGVNVPDIYREQGSSPANARFSTLQDLDAKRPTEVDMFLGTLMRLAEKHGIAVPYATYTYHAIKALEDLNAGLYDS